MAEEAGNGLDVGSVVEDVHGEAVAGTMPVDVLVDAGTFHPSLDGLTAAFVGGQIEDKRFPGFAIFGSADQTNESVIKRDGDPATGRVSFGLILLETQEFVGIINTGIAQILHIAEAHPQQPDALDQRFIDGSDANCFTWLRRVGVWVVVRLLVGCCEKTAALLENAAVEDFKL